jgi:hypothetical protein
MNDEEWKKFENIGSQMDANGMEDWRLEENCQALTLCT